DVGARAPASAARLATIGVVDAPTRVAPAPADPRSASLRSRQRSAVFPRRARRAARLRARGRRSPRGAALACPAARAFARGGDGQALAVHPTRSFERAPPSRARSFWPCCTPSARLRARRKGG